MASCSFFKYTKIDLGEVTETDRIFVLIDKQAVVWYTKNRQRKVLF